MLARITAGCGRRRCKGRFPACVLRRHQVDRPLLGITGKLIALSMLFLVASITYEVVARYFFHAPTIWVYEASYMVNGAAFMLGCAYALYKGAHVRTDIFWEKYSERTKGIIDLDFVPGAFLPDHDDDHADQHRRRMAVRS